MLHIYIKRRYISVVMLLILCVIMLAGCTQPVQESTRRERGGVEGEEQFDKLMDELFAEYVTSDSISMNYYIAYPDRLGLDKLRPATFGEAVTAERIRQSIEDNKDLEEQLARFNYDELRRDQQITYDILARNLEIFEVLESEESFAYYRGVFYPTAGLHVQLPIILAEFRFYSVEDIEIYLELLEDTQRYFNEQIDFERERSARGFFMTDANVDKVIGQCESFLENRENNLLIEVFNSKIDSYAGLSNAQGAQLKDRNRELVLGNVLPAYETLLSAMRELRGRGVHHGGLATLPSGREYAEAYLQYRTGSDRSPAQVETLLIEWMTRISQSISTLVHSNPNLSDRFFSGSIGEIKDGTHESYLAQLERAIAREFPMMQDAAQYVVREIHESLQDFMSPAFYLIPAFDNFRDNVIYMNPGSETDNLGLFTTLAHEGYPGHLYQVVYYLQQSPHPLRTVINQLGYDEGWATYAEMNSYFYAGLDNDEAQLMQYSRLFDLLFLSRIDLGVNAHGWEIARVASFLGQYGITDPEVVEDIFQAVIGYPLHYMPYVLGYLEMVTLREEATAELGSAFDLIEFHRFILDFGPAPFSLIREHMQGWIRAQASGAQRPAA